MNTRRKKFHFIGLLLSLALAAEVFFALDMAFTRAQSNLSPQAALIIFAAVLFLGVFLEVFCPKALSFLFLGVTGLLLAAAVAVAILWYSLYSNVYPAGEADKKQVFSGQRVLVLVPHEDDEQNILGGVFEQYVKYGSQIWVVYMTNGDYNVSVEQRFAETAAGMAKCGIPQSNLILLGYGDSLNDNGTSIYYCEDDQVIESHSGFSATHGTAQHSAFREGNSYTRRNLYEDIRDVVLRFMPDVIYCTDFDEHADHQALTLLFDRAMGEILRSRPDYEPIVFKAFAYSTGYNAPQDFYEVNIRSTKKESPGDYMPESNIYNWAQRLRLPVEPTTLSRSIFSSSTYQSLKEYRSQYTTKMADGIINGDKVFWQRETGSMSYDLEFWTSSGDAGLLNDFILVDKKENQFTPALTDATWVPDADDEEKRIIIKFPQPTDVNRIILYDNPSLTDNVLDASIRFDDGSFMMSGPLEINGSGTELLVGKHSVNEIEIVLMETEGSSAGFTELELYQFPYEAPFRFIKVTNGEGDFVYDYYIDPSGSEDFKLYAYGCSTDLTDYRVLCIGDGCNAMADGDLIRVTCPEGKSCTITVVDASGSVTDTVQIHNKNTWQISLAQDIENFMRKEFREGIINSNTWIILRDTYDALRGDTDE